jgi:hypothetical protein
LGVNYTASTSNGNNSETILDTLYCDKKVKYVRNFWQNYSYQKICYSTKHTIMKHIHQVKYFSSSIQLQLQQQVSLTQNKNFFSEKIAVILALALQYVNQYNVQKITKRSHSLKNCMTWQKYHGLYITRFSKMQYIINNTTVITKIYFQNLL